MPGAVVCLLVLAILKSKYLYIIFYKEDDIYMAYLEMNKGRHRSQYSSIKSTNFQISKTYTYIYIKYIFIYVFQHSPIYIPIRSWRNLKNSERIWSLEVHLCLMPPGCQYHVHHDENMWRKKFPALCPWNFGGFKLKSTMT